MWFNNDLYVRPYRLYTRLSVFVFFVDSRSFILIDISMNNSQCVPCSLNSML